MLALGWLCCLWLAAAGGPIDEQAVVKRPDGSPAAGAKVLLRQFRPDGHLSRELELTADAEGRVQARLDPPTESLRADTLPYFLVDVPGCALLVAQVRHNDNELKLVADDERTGLVIGPDGVGVAAARVECAALIPFKSPRFLASLNAPERGVRTPAATAIADARGVFTLRNVRQVGWGALSTALLTASGTQDGRTLVGEGPQERLDAAPQERRPPTLKLHPVGRLRGRVVDQGTGAPLAGARLTLSGEGSYLLARTPPAISGADGRYTFADVPTTPQAWCLAELPRHGRVALATRPAVDGQPAELVFQLARFTSLRGRVLDATTGQPPLTPTEVTVMLEHPGRYVDPDQPVTTPHATCQADGSFLLEAAPGNFALWLTAVGYQSQQTLRLSVPPEGVGGLDYQLERRPSFLLHLVRPDGTSPDTYDVELRQANGETTWLGGHTPGPYWSWPVRRWGVKAELRLWFPGDSWDNPAMNQRWFDIAADPAHWPQEVRVP